MLTKAERTQIADEAAFVGLLAEGYERWQSAYHARVAVEVAAERLWLEVPPLSDEEITSVVTELLACGN